MWYQLRVFSLYSFRKKHFEFLSVLFLNIILYKHCVNVLTRFLTQRYVSNDYGHLLKEMKE